MRCVLSQLIAGTLFASIFLTSISHADSGIRRIVHPDGRVEFTNIGSSGSGAVNSGASVTTIDISPSASPSSSVTSTPNRAAVRSQNIYSYRSPSGTLTFSDQRPSSGVKYEVMRFDCYACSPRSTVNWHTTRLFTDRYNAEIEREARRFNVDPALVRAVIHAESAFNPQAISPKGAQGLMQLMPPTASDLGVTNAMDTSQNIYGGVKYLSWMLERFNGDTRLATAAYNAGPGAVQRYGGIPPFAETQAYTERVAILHQRYRQLN